MPYKNRQNLPDRVRHPLRQVPHAQDIFLSAYNSAIDQYDGNESRAHAVAWSAVKEKYEKGDDELWHPKN